MESKLDNGLIRGHAYSITGLVEVRLPLSSRKNGSLFFLGWGAFLKNFLDEFNCLIVKFGFQK